MTAATPLRPIFPLSTAMSAVLLFAATTLVPVPVSAQTYRIDTVAGNPLHAGDGGPAGFSRLNYPEGFAFDAAGNLFVADSGHHRIRKIAASGMITTAAGTGVPGYAGDGGPATAALVDYPWNLAFDHAGNLYFIDYGCACIRRVNTTGYIDTVAGDGLQGDGGDGGLAAQAQLDDPVGLAIDAQNNIYVSEYHGARVRKIDGQGIITAFAGTGESNYLGDGGAAVQAALQFPTSLAFDSAGTLYIADNCSIRTVDPGGVIRTFAGGASCGYSGDAGRAPVARFSWIWSLSIDGAGNILVGDAGNNVIRKIDRAGIVSTIAGTGEAGFSGDGGPALSARLRTPELALAGPDGKTYINDSENQRIRVIDSGGVIRTAVGSADAGDGGPAFEAELGQPRSLAFGADGSLYLADGLSQIRLVDQHGTITTLLGRALDQPTGTNPDGVQGGIGGLVVDSGGNVFFSEFLLNRVRRLGRDGSVTTIAGGNGSGSGGDGDKAVNAQLDQPFGLALDASGNLYIADWGNNSVRMVDSGGIIRTVAGQGTSGYSGDGGLATSAQLDEPTALALDSVGNLYIAEWARVRKVTAGGIISTITGDGTYGFSGDEGSANRAQVSYAYGLAVDGAGNVLLNDRGNARVRMISASDGRIRTIAGDGGFGFRGDGGSAMRATFGCLWGIGVDRDGSVLLADCGNGRLRKLTATTTPDACAVSINAAGITAPAAGWKGALTVTPTQSTCSWNATASADWISVTSGASVTGAADLQVLVASNPFLSPRTGALVIGGKTIAVTEDGSAAAAVSISYNGVLNGASFLPLLAPGGFASVFANNLPATATWWDSAIPDGKTLPTMLNGVKVKIGGKDCYVSFVNGSQINVLLPPDVPAGLVPVEITAPQGSALAAATVAPYAPGFFAYYLNNKPYAAALFANTAVYVAQPGALSSVTSRPAKTGDYLQLYANGLGPTGETYPVGQVLTLAYPVADLSKITVTVGGVAAPVQWAGMTYAGLYQVNIQVPAGVAAGDHEIVLTIQGRSTQPGVSLAFTQ